MENKYFTPDIEEEEIWKDIPNYEEYYEVSNFGRVRRKAYIMKCRLTYDGYPAITLCGGGEQKSKTIHRLVAESFVENPNNKTQVNHKDGIKSNTAASNLEWVTPSENVIHALELGLKQKDWQNGEKNINSKLTETQVRDIKMKLLTEKVSKVYKEYSDIVSYNTIYAIKTGRLWKNL